MDYRGLVRGPRRLLAAMLAGCLMLVATACSPSDPTPSLRTLTVGATLEPPAMDPFQNTAASIPQVLLYNVYETLLKVNSEGHLTPLLAQRWTVSPDRKTYTFYLNPAAKFASGAPVDAEAVKANIDRLRNDPKLTETLRAQLEVVDSVEVLDPARVVITLNRPSLMWLYEMSSTLGMMVDPTFTGDLASVTAGSGPYKLEAHNRGQSVVLSRNEEYWGTPGRFDQVTFRYSTDPNPTNASMLAGELDVIANLQLPDALPQFSDTSRFTTITGTTNGEVVLGLNNATEALSKPEVRRALTMAIDRKALLDTVWNGQGTLIGSMVVPTDPWWEDLSNLTPYDPEKAKELLAEAGYSDGLTLRLRVPVIPYAVKSAQFVASQLRDIGVTATIEELEFSRWIPEVLTNGDYDMTIVGHVEARDIAKFANPDYYWHYDSAEFRRLFTTADEASEEDAPPLMKRAARYLAEDAAAIWLFALPNLVITKSTITGVAQNATSLSFDLTTIASA
jgi:peptide/nickel transport system substrate-binding protein